MVYLHRLYTRSGDAGETGLGDGTRVSKTSPRIVAMAAIDEVNAAVGVAAAGSSDQSLGATLAALQNDLFEIGAEICLPEAPPRITLERITSIEERIDAATAQRPPLTSFILPGGTPTAAALHLARTIARRAEIEILRLAETETINPQTTIYLNRLSDLLFALARLANPAGDVEPQWKPSERVGDGGPGETREI